MKKIIHFHSLQFLINNRSNFNNYNCRSLLIALLLTISSCGDDPTMPISPTLPPITSEGKNTIGFLLDGKLWLPETPFPDLSGSIRLACGISRSTRHLVLHTTRYISIRDGVNPAIDSVHQVLITSVDSISGPKIYKFKKREDILTDFVGKCAFIDSDYDLDQLTPSEFNVSYFDTTNQIIAGTFYMNLVTLVCNDTLHITEGRFDLKFNWVP